MSTPTRPPRLLQSPDDIVKSLTELPSVPAILPKLLTILNDVSASMEDVLSLIKLEPGIVLDDVQGEKTGKWKHSTHVSPFVGAVARPGEDLNDERWLLRRNAPVRRGDVAQCRSA